MMNRQEKDILHSLIKQPYINQRLLAEKSGHSLGVVNRCVKSLIENGYLTEDKKLTEKAQRLVSEKKTKSAIILAAGFGMRMVPINTEVPKGLLEVKGETLVERLIKQLQEAKITDIHVVVGFLKEQYEFLIDKYNVNLIVNREYAEKNNLFSLACALPHIENSYIVPCDIWCKENPFSEQEMYSWYMISDLAKKSGTVRLNRNMELIAVSKEEQGNRMIGIGYFDKEDAEYLKEKVHTMTKSDRFYDAFWEEALFEKEKMFVAAKVVREEDVFEINTYEQLRELDNNSSQLQAQALAIIAECFQVMTEEITNITVLKKGMTNRSFLFSCKGKQYIMRIPGEGTDKLINRVQEEAVYSTIKEYNLCDNVIYMNSENGYKITEYMENTRVCDPLNEKDVKICVEKLRKFHEMKLSVEHTFDIFQQIEFYEKLWNGKKSVYRDYEETKEKVLELKAYIDAQEKEWTLAHIDAVPDNFLFTETDDIRLIDWEYAGMQDPHVDLAMFSVYSYYDKAQVDKLLELYFGGNPDDSIRTKIYCYVAACGLLWSNWCEYKQQLGIELGEYSIKQYRYAKDFYKIAKKEMEAHNA